MLRSLSSSFNAAFSQPLTVNGRLENAPATGRKDYMRMRRPTETMRPIGLETKPL
ncbi:hypothetical protein FHS93_002611 [Sphingobium francense]|nr:hypothetical protein [Sphingobium indicum]